MRFPNRQYPTSRQKIVAIIADSVTIVILQPISYIISFVHRSIVLLKKEIKNTRSKHSMNNRNKMPSQQSNIPLFVNGSSNRN